MKISIKSVPFLLGVLLAFSLTFTSCRERDDDNPQQEQQQEDNFSDNFGNEVSRSFMGKIMDTSHNPISGVDVKIGSESTTTDANGIFILEDVPVYERFAYIEAEKAGYLKGSRTVVPTDAMNQISIMLLDENIAGTVSSGSTGEVMLSNGAKVTFDGAFKDASGNAYTGSVTVMMQHLDPSDPEISLKMPGSLYAQNANNNERILETYGMLNVELRGSGGEILNIADGHTATIELPVDPAQTNAPSTIPLWHFDEDNGYWIEDGAATKVGNKYVGEVSHFSWWNWDAQFPMVNLCMTLEDTNGDPVYGVQVLLTPNGMYSRSGYSNGNGEICGLIPANETLTMVVNDPCGNQVFTQSIGPFSSDTNLGVISIPAMNTSVISGTLLDCNNNPVTDGYVKLNYGSVAYHHEVIFTVTNGTFTFTTASCNNLTNFTLEGIDLTGFQTTGIVNNTFTAPVTNVGSLIACNGVAEYISVQVDNDSPIVVISPEAGISGNYISVGEEDRTYDIGIQGQPPVVGVYNSPAFDFSGLDRDYNVATNIQFVVSNVGIIGDYIDLTFSGTYTSTSGAVRNISGVAHVVRDY